MDRHLATKFLRDNLDKQDLTDWKIKLNTSNSAYYLGLCSYKDKTIILNAHHVDQHPEEEVRDTILHEIAHALTQGHQHDEVWVVKAIQLGVANPSPCASYSISEEVKDAIRSGADVEISFVEEVIRKPKAVITRLQDKCPYCSKVAVEESSSIIQSSGENNSDTKIIKLQCGHTLIKLIPKGTPFHKLISNWYEPKVMNCNHEWEINQCKHCREYKLFPFQIEGARFLEVGLASQKGSGIFDEMGLGKTIQALTYLKYHHEAYPVLFIVKSGIKFQWFKEILRWLGPMHLAQVIETSQDYIIPNLKCYIASYDIFTPRIKKGKSYVFDLSKLEFIKTVIMDEVQQIKNPDSTRTQQIRKIVKNKKVIALSGTPWKNRGSEYFTILNILAPMKFPSHEGFIRNWVDIYFDGQYTKQGGIKYIEQFRDYIKEIAIRREVDEVNIQMPSVNRTLHYAELDKYSQKEYDSATSEFVQWYNEKVIGGEEDEIFGDTNILAKMARMRHITGLAKIAASVEFAGEFFEDTDRKLTIFVHHKDVGEILFNELNKKFGKDIKVLKLTAEQSGEERFKIQEEFNGSARAFLVASTLASGEGINLQSCGDAILHERQWNPQNEDQAAPGRFRRIGSNHSKVNVIYMTASGTIDEILAGIVERKREYFHNTMNKGEMIQFNQSNFAKELAEEIVSEYNKKNRTKGKITQMASL